MLDEHVSNFADKAKQVAAQVRGGLREVLSVCMQCEAEQ